MDHGMTNNPNIPVLDKCPKCEGTNLKLKEWDRFYPEANPAVTVYPYSWFCLDCKHEEQGHYKVEEPEEVVSERKARMLARKPYPDLL
jgi:hypothetical protein